MKNKLKIYFRVLALALAMLLAWQCQTEEVAKENSDENANLSVFKFTSSEIPDIVSSFQEKLDKRNRDITAKDGEPIFWVDEESAIGVADSIGNMTYSFVMHVANGGGNSLYNLVVNRRVDGNDSPDFVMHYKFTDQQTIFEYSQMEEKKFKGKIDAFSFEAFLQSLGEASKGNITEPCYDDIPTDWNGDNGGGSGGAGTGGGNSGGSGHAPGPANGTSTGWSSIGSFGNSSSGGGSGSGNSDGTGRVEVGMGCFCAEPPAPDQKSSYASKADDCPKGEMLIPVNEDEDKIFNNLTGKADCVYEKLQNLSSGFKEMIKKFDGEFPVAHLKYSIDYNLPNSTNAVTNNSEQYLIEIKINGNTLDQRTVLGLARTLAHETIHAELYRKVRSVGGQISVTDFPGIYDYYRRNIRNWQHEQMAGHYRETIVDILQSFDNNLNSRQFYMDLAWEGLHGTTAWNNLSDSERTRITNVNNNHKISGVKNCN